MFLNNKLFNFSKKKINYCNIVNYCLRKNNYCLTQWETRKTIWNNQNSLFTSSTSQKLSLTIRKICPSRWRGKIRIRYWDSTCFALLNNRSATFDATGTHFVSGMLTAVFDFFARIESAKSLSGSLSLRGVTTSENAFTKTARGFPELAGIAVCRVRFQNRGNERYLTAQGSQHKLAEMATNAIVSEASITSKYATYAPAGGSVLFITVLLITLPKSVPPFRQIKHTYLSQCMKVISFASISRSSRFWLKCTNINNGN